MHFKPLFFFSFSLLLGYSLFPHFLIVPSLSRSFTFTPLLVCSLSHSPPSPIIPLPHLTVAACLACPSLGSTLASPRFYSSLSQTRDYAFFPAAVLLVFLRHNLPLSLDLSQRAWRAPRWEAKKKNLTTNFNGVAINFYLWKKLEKPLILQKKLAF